MERNQNKEQDLKNFLEEVLNDCKHNWSKFECFLFDSSIQMNQVPSDISKLTGAFTQYYQIFKGYHERVFEKKEKILI